MQGSTTQAGPADDSSVGAQRTEGSSLFRVLRREPDKPLASSLLAVLGGLFLFTEGIVDAGSGSYFSGLSLSPVAGTANQVGAASILLGTLLMASGIYLYQTHGEHQVIGVLITALALLSVAVGGGFLFGAALGIAGGVSAISWLPRSPFYISPADSVMCRHCGGIVPATPAHAHCPICHRSS